MSERSNDKERISEGAFVRYEAEYERVLYMEKSTEMFGSEHQRMARRAMLEMVFAECGGTPFSAGTTIMGVELLKAVDALTVERADELAEWADQQARIDEKMPQDMHRKTFQHRMRGLAAACKIAREYLRARSTPSSATLRRDPVDPESEEANPVWDLVIAACCQAWPNSRVDWNCSPTELIIDIINERDEAVADAERYRLIRGKLCNRESLEFDRFPNVLNLAGMASIKPSEIDAAVDEMRSAR